MDRLIDILRSSADGSAAKISLKTEFELSDAQADAILTMPMRRLTGLEKDNLYKESTDLRESISKLELLLSDRHELLKSLKRDLRSLKRKYNDPRRTKITDRPKSENTSPPVKTPTAKVDHTPREKKVKEYQQMSIIEPITPVPVSIAVDHQGDIRRDSPRSSQDQQLVVKRFEINSDRELTLIASTGKAYPLKLSSIPSLGSQSIKGTNLIPSLQGTSATIVNYFTPDDLKIDQKLILLTSQGRIKRLPISELGDLTNRGLSLIKLKEDDKLQYILPVKDSTEVVVGTSSGRLIRLHISENQIPILGRSSQGIPAIKLSPREHLICCLPVQSIDELILVSQAGYTKKIPVMALPLTQVGGLGNTAMRFINKTDGLVGAAIANLQGTLKLLTNHPRVYELSHQQIKIDSKDSTGEKLLKLNKEEVIITVSNDSD